MNIAISLYGDGKNSYFQKVSVAGGSSVNQIVLANREISKSGYVYIYVSKESKDFKVYFDNLKVTHIRGPLLSEEGYYPFGMTMNAISSTAGTVAKNNYKFNAGTELNETFDINYYETYFRQYDAQLGRFTGVDALADFTPDFTPYHYSMNDPVFWKDPSGLLAFASPTPKVNLWATIGLYANLWLPLSPFGYADKAGESNIGNDAATDHLFHGFSGIPFPTPAPNNIIGTSSYYRYRYDDFKKRYVNTGITPPDYYMEYGDKYVHRFSEETFKIVSVSGKVWIRKVLFNLQLVIEKQLRTNPTMELRQKQFDEFAFNSHVDIYVEAGFLELNIMDKLKIALTPDPSDLFSAHGRKQAVEIGKKQANFYVNNPKIALSQMIEAYQQRNVIRELIIKYALKNSIEPMMVFNYFGLYGFPLCY